MHRLLWALAGCSLLLVPNLAIAESPTAYATRVYEHQTGEAKKAVGDPVPLVTGEVAAVQRTVQTLDPGPLVQGATDQANATLQAALKKAADAAGPIGQDATNLANSALGLVTDKAANAGRYVDDERAYANRVLRRYF